MRARRQNDALKVEVLYFDGCPSTDRLLPRLRELVALAAVPVDVELRRVETPEAAVAARFLGSPTVRVDGEDIDPDARERSDYGLKCRLYRTDHGLRGTPPDEWIVAALDERKA